jgi:predicted DNA-binding ribbon-helix-helix protein
MADEARFRKTLVTLESAQWEYLRRAGFARRTTLSALVRELVEEAMRTDRWPEVHQVRR